eukprot:429659-Pleurochrysis_carterae.AAC.1
MPELPSSRSLRALVCLEEKHLQLQDVLGYTFWLGNHKASSVRGLLELVRQVLNSRQLQVIVAQGMRERVDARALSILRRARICALLVELRLAFGLQLHAHHQMAHRLLVALPRHLPQFLLLLLDVLAPAHERRSCVSLAKDGTRASAIAARPCAYIMISLERKYALSACADHGYAAHAPVR